MPTTKHPERPLRDAVAAAIIASTTDQPGDVQAMTARVMVDWARSGRTARLPHALLVDGTRVWLPQPDDVERFNQAIEAAGYHPNVVPVDDVLADRIAGEAADYLNEANR